MTTPEQQQLLFRVPDLEFPCIDDAAFTPSGKRVELAGRRAPGKAKEEVRLLWKTKKTAPDLLYHASLKLFISQKARECWQLEDGEALTLHPLALVDRKKTILRSDYWWVDIHAEHSILDEERSVIERSGRAILRIPLFRVAWNRVPDLNLFLCRETYSPVLSSVLVERSRFCGLSGAHFIAVDGGSWPPKLPK